MGAPHFHTHGDGNSHSHSHKNGQHKQEQGNLEPPRLEEVSDGIYAYLQPDWTWMINNTGLVLGSDGVTVSIICLLLTNAQGSKKGKPTPDLPVSFMVQGLFLIARSSKLLTDKSPASASHRTPARPPECTPPFAYPPCAPAKSCRLRGTNGS
jgi:hypothetical protein